MLQNAFSVIQAVSIIMGFGALVALTLQRSCEEQKYLTLAAVSAVTGSVGCLAGWMGRGSDSFILGEMMQCFGKAFCVFFLFLFIMSYFKERIPSKVMGLILGIVILRCLAVLVFGMKGRGAVYYTGSVLDILINLYSAALLFRCYESKTAQEQRNAAWICGVGILFIGLSAAGLCGMFSRFDAVPACACIICAVITFFVIRKGLFGIQHFAQSDVLHQIEQGVILADRYYNLVDYNEMAGRWFPELKELKKGEKVNQCGSLAALFEVGQDENIQAGSFSYQVKRNTITDKTGISGYSVWIYDVTETKKIIGELTDLKNQADHSNREKSNFLANMSHEIRTPLNVIIGSTELILREHASDTIIENASTIKQSGQNLLGLINDILDFSKIEAGKMDIAPMEYSLDLLLTDMVNMAIVRMDQKHLDFIVDVAPDVPRYLLGDDIRIKQIVLNLLTNAVKFTENGYIKLRVFTVPSPQENDKEVVLRFEVEDSGIGIKEENQKKLFDSFSRFDTIKNRAVEGTGLGLAISLMLAEKMHGKLGVQSEYGSGSCFSLELPQKICSAKEEPVSVHYKKALIMETNPEYLKIFKTIFQSTGIVFDIAASQEQFFEMLNRSYDVLFVDKEVYNSSLVTGLKADKVVLLDKHETVRRRQDGDLMLTKQLLAIKLPSVLNRTYSKELRANAKASERRFVAPDANILIVDDNAVNLKIAAELLKPFQMQVDTVDSGKGAIEKLEKSDYDIVFMDHMMPEMDGIETTSRIRTMVGEKYQNLVIVALTANAVNGAKNTLMSAGMQDFLAKPIEMTKLIRVLKKWLPGEKIIEKRESDTEEAKEVDWEAGLMNFEGNQKQYEMALKIYAMMAERFIEEMSKNLKIGDLKSIGGVVHTFASESERIGAKRFAAFLMKYERACIEENEKFVKNNYRFFQKQYGVIADKIKLYLEKNKKRC